MIGDVTWQKMRSANIVDIGENMVKYVYPDTHMQTLHVKFRDYIDFGQLIKSWHADGRIIADDNILEGL